MHEVGAHKPALLLGKGRMRQEDRAHLFCARLEDLKKITVTPAEVLQHVCQQDRDSCRVQRQNAIDDVVCARPIRGVEVARFGGRFKRAHHNAFRVGVQMKCLSVEERILCQGASIVAEMIPLGIQYCSDIRSMEDRRDVPLCLFGSALSRLVLGACCATSRRKVIP